MASAKLRTEGGGGAHVKVDIKMHAEKLLLLLLEGIVSADVVVVVVPVAVAAVVATVAFAVARQRQQVQGVFAKSARNFHKKSNSRETRNWREIQICEESQQCILIFPRRLKNPPSCDDANVQANFTNTLYICCFFLFSNSRALRRSNFLVCVTCSV